MEARLDALVVYEDERTLAFLANSPASRGHTLVVPKEHAQDLWTLPERDAASVMVAATRVAALLRAKLAPDGLNLTQTNGEIAGQTMFHFHLHLIPRYLQDGLPPRWEGTQATIAHLTAVQRLLGT